jgi:hypothetical protein
MLSLDKIILYSRDIGVKAKNGKIFKSVEIILECCHCGRNGISY